MIEALPLTGVGKPYKLGLRLDATRRVVSAELAAQGADCALERIVWAPHDGGVRVLLPAHTNEAVRDKVTAALDQYALDWRYAPPPG